MTSCTLLNQRRALVKRATERNLVSRLVESGHALGHPVIFHLVGDLSSTTIWMWKVVWGDVMVEGKGLSKKNAKKNAARKMIKRIVGNIQNKSSRKVKEADIIQISDDDHEGNHGINNNACTLDIENTSWESKRKEKSKKTGKKSKKGLKMSDQDLYPGKYNIVSVHAELLRSSQHSSTSLTQIGCVAYGSDDCFFRSIKPSCLEEYLDGYKLGGDLLQAVHMTREDDGTFLYRKRFEDVEEADKVVCVEENEALGSLRGYLKKYPNCVILGVDQETLAILADKIGFFNLKKLNVVGFTYWKRVLEYLDVEDYNKVDLEDFCGDSMESYNSALDIAKVLMNSVDGISSQKKSGKMSMTCKFYKLCKNIDFLGKPEKHVYKNGYGDYIEVSCSFRPTSAATISAEKVEQVVITSESDSEPEKTRSMDCQEGQSSMPSYWKIGKFRGGEFGKQGEPELCVFCPQCNIRIRFKRIRAHIKINHAQFLLGRSLLCAVCDKEVLPSEVPVHMPSCNAGLSTKGPASSTKASKISSSSKSNSKPSKPGSAKVNSTPKVSQEASKASARSDQLKSIPLRRSSRLLKISGLSTAQGKQRKIRVQTARPLPPANPPSAPATAGPPVTLSTVSAGPPCETLTASAAPSCAPPRVLAGPPCAPPPVLAGPTCASSTAPDGSQCAPPPVSVGPPCAPSTAPAGPPYASSQVSVGTPWAPSTAKDGPPPPCALLPVPCAQSTAPASPPCALSPVSTGPPCASPSFSAGPPCTPSTAPAEPPYAPPPVSAGLPCAPLTAPAAPPCAPPPVSAGPSSPASIGPPLFFNNGPGLIHPDLDVFEGVPENMLRCELERYIITNFYPVGRGGWGYVHCLWMYEDYQRAMVSQGRRVIVSPHVFSVLVREVCEKHWGIVLDDGNSQFQFCFVGIVPRPKE